LIFGDTDPRDGKVFREGPHDSRQLADPKASRPRDADRAELGYVEDVKVEVQVAVARVAATARTSRDVPASSPIPT
jgi:hypothetical protein